MNPTTSTEAETVRYYFSVVPNNNPECGGGYSFIVSRYSPIGEKESYSSSMMDENEARSAALAWIEEDSKRYIGDWEIQTVEITRANHILLTREDSDNFVGDALMRELLRFQTHAQGKLLSKEDVDKFVEEARRRKSWRFPRQPENCQRFQGQQYPEQHRKPEIVKNATGCGICGASADKLESGIYVCQSNGGHMADGMVGIWQDLSYCE